MKVSIFLKTSLQYRIFATNIVLQLQGSKEILYSQESVLVVLKANETPLTEFHLKLCLLQSLTKSNFFESNTKEGKMQVAGFSVFSSSFVTH